MTADTNTTNRTTGGRAATRLAAATAAVALAVATGIVAATAAPAAAGEHDPILFVHGFGGNGDRWATMVDRFEADGWASDRLFTISYDSTKSNAEIALDVRDAVDDIRATTGAAEVDIVAMSMGGLNTRHYMKFLGGAAVVDDYVSLAGPNHGTTTASLLCLGGGNATCNEMKPGSPFLANLNSGDETPGDADYGTFWSPCDNMINPDSSVSLAGAANTRVGCISHADFLTDPSVYGLVRDVVA
jgi:triacylglycerol lipase